MLFAWFVVWGPWWFVVAVLVVLLIWKVVVALLNQQQKTTVEDVGYRGGSLPLMALILCPKCKKTISDCDIANSCLNCGYYFTPEENRENRNIVIQNLKSKAAPDKKTKIQHLIVYVAASVVGIWLITRIPEVFQLISRPTILERDVKADAPTMLQRIHRDVAADAVRQYEIAKRSGSAIDAYVGAGFVAAAYLQAKDEANYRKWKAIEYQEGIRAGIQ